VTEAHGSPLSSGRLPASFLTPGSASFTDFLAAQAAHLLPGERPLPPGPPPDVPHATTIVAMTFAGGVLMAGDRRATMGNVIAHREIEKVFPADEYSCVGSPAPPAWPPSWSGCSRSSWSTTRRSRARCCRWTGRPTGCPR
jgi:hypothetical protein